MSPTLFVVWPPYSDNQRIWHRMGIVFVSFLRVGRSSAESKLNTVEESAQYKKIDFKNNTCTFLDRFKT